MAGDVLPPRYTSITLIASGGMGNVYRATDSELGRIVAIKVLAERHSQNIEVRHRFKREAHLAARLSAHPHVVTVFDVGEYTDRPFIVMEYLEGGSVDEHIRSSPIGNELALTWIWQAATALDAAHARGIVHRDVKPANLLLDKKNDVQVTDFGIASAIGLDTLTMPGTVLGTAGYLSPEQARGEPATAASDRYGLGVVAFELLTGHRPFATDTPVTEAYAHAHAPVPSIEQIAPWLPGGVDAVFQRGLAKDPDARQPSAIEFAEDLRSAFRREDTATMFVPVPAERQISRSRMRRGLLLLLAFAALVVAGLSAAAFVSNNQSEPREQTVTRVRTVVSTVSDTASTFTLTETTTVAPETPDTVSTPRTDNDRSGASLNDDAFRLMQAGRFDEALPILERAVTELMDSGTLAEAYASYNLAVTRFTLGRCDGVLDLLAHSEAIQGHRSEIDRLRRKADSACQADGS
jgi:serine/threonine protein kinase